MARQMKKDKAKYFGPYTSAGAVKDTIELIRNCIRSAAATESARDCGKERPCLYYHINQCAAPCQGNVSEEAYKQNIGQVLHFLNGNYKETIEQLTEKMKRLQRRCDLRMLQDIGISSKYQKIGEAEDYGYYAGKMTEILWQLPWMKVIWRGCSCAGVLYA